MPTASVSAFATWSTSGPCTQGSFSLRHLPTGDYEIVVATDELSPLGERTWSTKTRIAQAEHRAQDLTWPKGVTLTGVIVDQGGAPIAEARLSATPEPWNGRPNQRVIVRADGSGHFAFRHLAPGRWTLEGDFRPLREYHGPRAKPPSRSGEGETEAVSLLEEEEIIPIQLSLLTEENDCLR